MDWESFLAIIGGLLAIGASIYGITQFIDARIEKKISEDAFLRKMAAFIRPVAIFDEHESILIDQGAMSLIEKIEVVPINNSHLPERIIVYPKKHLAHAPLLETMDNENVEFIAKRGKKFEWHYKLHYEMHMSRYDNKRRFRIEIIQ